MNTHLLIQIKDLENKIILYREDIKVSERGGDYIRAAAFAHMVFALNEILEESKQISLDEKDAEKRAKELYDLPENYNITQSNNICEIFVEGYKQALKDLL